MQVVYRDFRKLKKNVLSLIQWQHSMCISFLLGVCPVLWTYKNEIKYGWYFKTASIEVITNVQREFLGNELHVSHYIKD